MFMNVESLSNFGAVRAPLLASGGFEAPWNLFKLSSFFHPAGLVPDFITTVVLALPTNDFILPTYQVNHLDNLISYLERI